MKELKTLLREKLLAEAEEPHIKDSFWATESETNQFDIYHRWLGTTPTNPMTPEHKLSLSVRKMVEEAFVNELDKLGILIKPTEGGQHRIEMEREGIKITGYMDAIIQSMIKNKNKIGIEFKTSFGKYAKEELENGIAKTSYLKQLAIYMDFWKMDIGYLIQANFADSFLLDGLYQFTLVKNGNQFTSNKIKFDIVDTYKRWAKIYQDYILPKIEPLSEYRYKYPIEEIDWSNLSKTKISEARNNRLVIGDWQAKYSSYLDLMIQREKTVRGYTEQELTKIRELTKGFSKK